MLKRRGDISRALKKGKKYRGKYLTLVTAPPGLLNIEIREDGEKRTQPPMMAALVKKRCGKSVKRVRMKRLVREFFRLRQELFEGYEAVIFYMDTSIENEAEFKAEMLALAEKAKRMKK